MLIQKIKRLTSDGFLKNLGWLGIAEVINRFFRLGTTVILAYIFNSYEYGIISIIYTIFDFAHVLTLKAGIAAKIIHTSEKELNSICNTSYWLNWLLGGLLFILQCSLSYPLALFYKNNQLILPICTVALAHLIIPLYTVQIALIEKDNRLKVTALCNASQGIIINVMTLILALLGQGVMAISISIVVSYFSLVIIAYKKHSWRPPRYFTLEKWQEITSYGSKLLGVDILNRIRMYLDYLLIGPFLGIEALGIYFFAFNAGLGISQGIIYSTSSAIFPHLCACREDTQRLKQQFFKSLKAVLLIVIPLVIVQSSLAPLYVPIIFGEKWVKGIPILMIICISAIPLSLSRVNSQLLQAIDKTHIDLYWNIIFTLIFAASLLVAITGGITSVALAVLISQAVAVPIFSLWLIRYVFGKGKTTSYS
jgi:O-antigen/teichoic acid export membrane protein